MQIQGNLTESYHAFRETVEASGNKALRVFCQSLGIDTLYEENVERCEDEDRPLKPALVAIILEKKMADLQEAEEQVVKDQLGRLSGEHHPAPRCCDAWSKASPTRSQLFCGCRRSGCSAKVCGGRRC